MKPFLARLICHTSFPCCCYILAWSLLPSFCAWLLPCPFPSEVPGQHQRAFITNMQVPVPIVSNTAFFWCKSSFGAKTNCNVNRNARSSDHAVTRTDSFFNSPNTVALGSRRFNDSTLLVGMNPCRGCPQRAPPSPAFQVTVSLKS